ncbi:MAG: hypothetical protein Q8R76_02285 [Candidatus Omnitrophota bacterium]|nr:hypothetical protein [Candidatus Omnitrophota bacterium]
MVRFFVYLLLFGGVLYLLSTWGKKQGASFPSQGDFAKARNRLRGKTSPREMWVQVYETATVDEARVLQARLQEEEVECIVYEQGKKDIHGNEPMGVGLAVPKSALRQAQGIITRMST